MTLLKRNYIFKAGILVALTILVGICVTASATLPAYPALIQAAARRSSGFIQGLMIRLNVSVSPYGPFISTISTAAYALVTLILIYRFFEKTNAPEILYVAFFVLSFAFEGIRVIIPLKSVYELSGLYLLMSFRFLLFARYFGVFSLFTASVCAAGLQMQKQRTAILILAIISLVFALGFPLDPFAWDSSLKMLNGYPALVRMVEASIIVITVVSFLIASYSRGSREYLFVGAGSLLAFLGRNILLNADTWIVPLPGILFLALGTWFVCTYLHRIYLWL